MTDGKQEICIKDGEDEFEMVETDKRRLKDGRVEVRGTWVARGPATGRHRRKHTRARPRRRR